MTTTLLPGIIRHDVRTPRLTASVLERPATTANRTVVFIHGNVSSSSFWQPSMLALSPDVRAIAIDLRGFGDSEILPVNATRGVRDFSDDVASVVAELGIERANFVGWSMGGGVVLQFLLDHPEKVLSVSLISPVSPYGFGGTHGADGHLTNADSSGTGGGGANPDFVERLQLRDTTDESPTSPRAVYRSTYVKNAALGASHEDLWVESMLSTATGIDNYPGDSTATDSWPGFAPGGRGVLNTMAPNNFNVAGIVDVTPKPPILWFRGEDDVIVSDNSAFGLNHLGKLGVIPGWPGIEAAPPQPMIQQTRNVFEKYQDAGGNYQEIVFENCGHSAHLERPAEFLEALQKVLVFN